MLILGTGELATQESELEWVLGTFTQFPQFTCGVVGVLPTMSNYPLARSVGTLAGTQEPKFTMDAAHR